MAQEPRCSCEGCPGLLCGPSNRSSNGGPTAMPYLLLLHATCVIAVTVTQLQECAGIGTKPDINYEAKRGS